MTLPTTPRSRVEIPPQRASVFLAGPAKSGKSTLAANFGGKETLICDTQEGTIFLNGEFFVAPIKSWSDFTSVVADLVKGSQFKTVVIDMVPDLWAFCDQAYAGNKAPTASSTDDFQRSIKAARADFRSQIGQLQNAGLGVWALAHTREIQDGEQSRHKVSLDDASIREFLIGMAPYVWIIENDGARRVVVCQPSPRFEAGARIPGFPDTLPLDSRAVWKALDQHLNPSKYQKKTEPTEVAA